MKLYATFTPIEIAPASRTSEYYAVLRCRCGAMSEGSSMVRATVPAWTFDLPYAATHIEQGEPVTMHSQDSGCREITYSNLWHIIPYVTNPTSLIMTNIGRAASAFDQSLIESIANSLWLGISSSDQRLLYVTDASGTKVSLPAEWLLRENDAGGPMFSILSWWFKAGSSITERLNYNRERAESFVETVFPLINGPLTKTSRKSLLREGIRFMTSLDSQDYVAGGYHTYSSWGKMLLLWSSLGGMDYLNATNGYGYYSASRAKVAELGLEKVCPHTLNQGFSTPWTGSLTFYERFFSGSLDGRAVTRFLSGGTGPMKKTAVKYLRIPTLVAKP